MSGQVERYAHDMGWAIGTANVLVEGTSDVAYLRLAGEIWLKEKGHDLFADDFAVFEAGRGDDGGVQGIVRQLQTLRQLADRDVSNRMAYRRVVGLFDNDHAGRSHVDMICKIDFRMKPYRDVFLLHPTMPISNGLLGRDLQLKTEGQNQSCTGLDWEIEDFLSEDLMRDFTTAHPKAVINKHAKAGHVHWELTKNGKRELCEFARCEAVIEDVIGIVRLLCALRDYLGLEHEAMRP